MNENVITVIGTCVNGHTETINLVGFGMQQVEAWAGLMDGSSPFYQASPRGTDSAIGKCGVCGAQFDCRIVPPVDRTARTLTDGSPVTEDHREITQTGQQKAYVVLSPEERAKGFQRPLRRTYIHVGLKPVMRGSILIQPGLNGCGHRTTMGRAIAETYARDPGFYSGTFCCSCGQHRPLDEFIWEGTTEQVGS